MITRGDPLTSGITKNAVTAAEMMADVRADASFCHSVTVLSAYSPGLFLYFRDLNSLCSFRLTVLNTTGILELRSTHG